MSKELILPFSAEKLLAKASTSVKYFVDKFCEGAFTAEDIEDIIEDVVYKALSRVSTFNPEKGSFSTWVRTISLNTVKTALHDKGRSIRCFSNYFLEERLQASSCTHTSSPDYEIRAEDIQNQVDASVRSDRDRTILRLRAEGYDSAEIAQKLSLTPGVVYLAVHKAKTRLGSAA